MNAVSRTMSAELAPAVGYEKLPSYFEQTPDERTAFVKSVARELLQHCLRYVEPDTGRALVQLATTLPLYLATVALMIWGASVSWWIPLVLGIPAGGLLVRLFIIQHDCGHGSFLKSKAANDMIGRFLSVLTFTPYSYWRRSHTLHHATSGNLDRRGVGDVTTLTVREYLALPPLGRLKYRLYRNPLVLILIGAPVHFAILQRLPFLAPLSDRHTRHSILGLDLAILAVYGALFALFGWATMLMVLAPIVCVGAWAGGWLFFVQHQFEDTHWDDGDAWDMQVAAVAGSSYYVLPKPLQWFTGNIGFHHVHHLCSRIPNYRLEECANANTILAGMNRLTLIESIRCARLALWDEASRRLIGFGDLERV